MAGEVEESFSINFQADSIHSGSISFGRFESEPLCWERRSSFSHNRYLEEVEKCSKPGSVIEKKAYFEAHFKKKGLFGIIPSAGHDRSDRATSANDSPERVGNQEDFESSDDNYVQYDQRSQEDFEPNEDGHYVQIEKRFKDNEPNEDDYHVQFDQSSQEDSEPNEDGHYVQIEQRFKNDEPNEDDHHVQFDQRFQEDFEPDEGGCYVKIEHRSQDFEPNEDGYVHFGDIPVSSDSGYHAEFEVIGYGSEDAITECPMLSFPSTQIEFARNNSDDLEDANNIRITLDEDRQFENERSNLLSTNDEAITEVKRDDDDTVNTDESSRNMRMAVNEPAQDAEKTILHDPSNPSQKLEPGLNSEVNNVGVRKSASSKSPTDPARRMNMEKNLSKLATPITRSASRTPKEVSRSVDKLIRENESISEKASRVKKAAESQPSVLKTDSNGIQEAERMNRAFGSTKSDVRPRAAAFNFKSSERAERRKEFYLKLEEKLHAKEAEMNQMQAISQEKKKADIKKLRKSLNFKATPMPSFYRTTLPSQSHGNKAVSNNIRCKRVQNKPKCRGSGSEAAASSKLKMGNGQTADESVAATEPHSISTDESTETNTSEAGSMISPAPSTNQSCLSTSVTNNHTSEKKERSKVTSQKHRVSESCKGPKRQSDEGNKNGKTTKQRNETVRKGVRNVGLRSSSRNGNLAVCVAS